MAITQAVCNSFKQQLLVGDHNFANPGGDVFYLALYLSTATLGAGTTVYTTSGETSGPNYTAGGNPLVSVTPVLSGSTAVCDFNDLTFSNVTITAAGALIYNSSQANKAVMVLNFGGDKSATAGDFQIIFPTADASNAILRLS